MTTSVQMNRPSVAFHVIGGLLCRLSRAGIGETASVPCRASAHTTKFRYTASKPSGSVEDAEQTYTNEMQCTLGIPKALQKLRTAMSQAWIVLAEPSGAQHETAPRRGI